jgi:hypothetical protein
VGAIPVVAGRRCCNLRLGSSSSVASNERNVHSHYPLRSVPGVANESVDGLIGLDHSTVEEPTGAVHPLPPILHGQQHKEKKGPGIYNSLQVLDCFCLKPV